MQIILTIIGLASIVFGASLSHAADTYSTKDSPSLAVGSEATSNPFAGIYFGVNAGGQFTSIAMSHEDFDEAFDGISNDGLVGGGHVGVNICPGRVCVGARFEGGWSNGETTFADIDILTFDSYRQLVATAAALVGKSTKVGLHGGYEWQDWTVGNDRLGFEEDAELGFWVVGASIETLIAANTSLGVKVDYLMLDTADIGRVGDVSDLLEDTEALRVQATVTYYPTVNLPSLESLTN
jgi:hypothetical protein